MINSKVSVRNILGSTDKPLQFFIECRQCKATYGPFKSTEDAMELPRCTSCSHEEQKEKQKDTSQNVYN